MSLDGFVHQLPDADPTETTEWLESLDAVIDAKGPARARYLLAMLGERARSRAVGSPLSVSTPYVNTIPTDDQPWFPGDEAVEKWIRRYIRWNAAVMVDRANQHAEGIGGHLSTFASSASLYEVGFNHFFRGHARGKPGDAVYIQGHAAPGIYARAFVEHRLEEDQLDNFRRELGDAPGLSSYPHPWLMPDFWEYPTVSMGLGPLNSIYHARFLDYLHNRRIDDTSDARVWCFLGDGECDEPETLGSISLAAREGLDNLIWVVNCNLQRLDGPVRGNGKVIQELESIFRGAGWNVIKVIWGSRWDELLADDVDGVLLKQMNSTLDGEFQRYAVEDGAYIREHFFGPDPRLRKLVEHLSDDELRTLPRGGHDYTKLYAAYQLATEQRGAPTVILAKTVKGWTLGPGVEARNATHQIKKMTMDEFRVLRDRLHLTDQIPDSALEGPLPPYARPQQGSEVHDYLLARREELGGMVPERRISVRRPMPLPDPGVWANLDAGSGGQAVSTTMAFTRLLRDLCRDPEMGRRVVPIVSDEARTFGMDSLFRELEIYASHGQLYEPVDHALLLRYAEDQDGQILEEGITEAGSMASWTAAGTSYVHRGVPMLPFFTFYSMFGFQRVGDLIWAAADAQARGFLMGATAGRTTLMGEGLQHQDGHSLVLASTVPTCRAYDPAFAYELGALIRRGIDEMYGDLQGPSTFWYLTIYNENYQMPARPDGVTDEDIVGGIYRWANAPDDLPADAPRVTLLFSGTAWQAAADARDALARHHGVAAELWSVTSYKALREEALSVERWNRLHPAEAPRVPRITEHLGSSMGPIVAVTDFMKVVPDQIARFVPVDEAGRPRRFVPLGTDGFGRSDTREALRRHFETDSANVAVAALAALAEDGVLERSEVAKAIAAVGIDPEAPDPRNR